MTESETGRGIVGILQEMLETLTKTGRSINRSSAPAPLPKPPLRLLQGGKEAPCGDSSPD
jgi:hypothetical protein